jgi:hypothetical protein
MPQRSVKKEVGIYTLGQAINPDEINADEVSACRLYCFSLAEDLYVGVFEELRNTCLPLCRNIGELERKRKLRRLAELEQRIERWSRTLNLVRYEQGQVGAINDFWVRELAFQRLQAWQNGHPRVTNAVIGGRMPSLVVPGRLPYETDHEWHQRVKNATTKYDRNVPLWRRSGHFHHHFEWYVRHRVGKLSFQAIADDCNRLDSSQSITATTILRGCEAISKLIDRRTA